MASQAGETRTRGWDFLALQNVSLKQVVPAGLFIQLIHEQRWRLQRNGENIFSLSTISERPLSFSSYQSRKKRSLLVLLLFWTIFKGPFLCFILRAFEIRNLWLYIGSWPRFVLCGSGELLTRWTWQGRSDVRDVGGRYFTPNRTTGHSKVRTSRRSDNWLCCKSEAT